MEGGKGENFRPRIPQADGYIKPAGFPNTMVAVSGFTTISGAFSGSGIWARLSCGRVVLDVPFNPTYGLSPHRAVGIGRSLVQESRPGDCGDPYRSSE